MKNDLYVNTNSIKSIADSLKIRNDAIKSIYEKQVKVLLEESKDTINVSGINFNDIDSQFNKAFMSLSSNLEELSNVLINQILPKYDDLTIAIRSAFNDKFASQMSELLKSIQL